MAAMADGKWHGVVTDVIPAPIETVWPILADFDGYHKNFPQIFSSCDTIEGEKNKVGSVRTVTAPLPDGQGIVEAKERLIHLDDVNHTTAFTIENITFGWTGYKGTIAAKSTENGQTSIVWSFEVNPVSGGTKEEFLLEQQGLFHALLNLLKEKVAA